MAKTAEDRNILIEPKDCCSASQNLFCFVTVMIQFNSTTLFHPTRCNPIRWAHKSVFKHSEFLKKKWNDPCCPFNVCVTQNCWTSWLHPITHVLSFVGHWERTCFALVHPSTQISATKSCCVCCSKRLAKPRVPRIMRKVYAWSLSNI